MIAVNIRNNLCHTQRVFHNNFEPALIPEYSLSVQLVLVIIFITGLSAVAWFLMVTPLRVYQRASLQFTASNVFFALGFGLSALRNDNSSVLFWLINDLALVAGFLCYRTGIYKLFRLPNNGLFDKAVSATLVLLVISAIVLSPSIAALSVVTSVICTVALGLTVTAKYNGLRTDMGPLSAAMLSLPAFVICCILAVKSTLLWLDPELAFVWFIRPQVDSEPLLWTYLIAIVMANAGAFGAALTKLIFKIRKLAERDQLTGLYNRRAIKMKLAQAWKWYKRSEVPFSVLLVDVDHFKDINDRYGHDAGDAAIKHVSKIMRTSFRETDSVCRYGGEEFLILLADCDSVTAVPAAEKLRHAIASHPLEWQQITIDVAVSIGCASMPAYENIDMLLQASDKALYEAKAKGRNCVVPAPDAEKPTPVMS